ncbi:putative Urease accessory protein UreD [Magnetofaba australis IT-1]|uniref:Putative Urease accessory protein UreD n=1 Tax=Magnetofaba australis IT-1 TaxID=1434232 RepID=A0A1Y2K5Q6_9PROT|nr:putative Urease accessory protein UreD [Magnetofaba australis IT-1]
MGGDELDIEITTLAGAQGLAMAQAAEKIYGSNGPDCNVTLRLNAHDGARLEWLPQESILFDQARLRRHTDLYTAGSGEILAGEMLTFGRMAMGERVRSGLARDAWTLSDDAAVVWRDALHMEGDVAEILADPACFDGAQAAGSIVHVGPDYVATAREILAQLKLPEEVLAAAGRVAERVNLIRWLGRDAQQMRKAYGAFWKAYRHQVWQRPEKLPRLWEI